MVDDSMENEKDKNEKIESKKKDKEIKLEIESKKDESVEETTEKKNEEKVEVAEAVNKRGKDKKPKNIFSTPETITLVIIALIIGLTIGRLLNKTSIITSRTVSNDEYLSEFVENYQYIIDNYYEEIDKEELINSAISGMMESLDDPYSMYMDEDESNNFSITLEGSYKGIGIQISKDSQTGYMLVSGVFDNSPASEAGIKVGDMIMAVGDTSAVDLTASEFSSLILQSDESSFILKISMKIKKLY